MPPHTKLHRWIDILTELLSRSFPITFDELAKKVPDYRKVLDEIADEGDAKRKATMHESLKRTWERDKKELRAFGITLESHPDEEGNDGGAYRLKRSDFYLPYLCFVLPDGTTQRPERIDKFGYQALKSLTFEADELRAVVDAAAMVRSLGDPLLAHEASNALRKLAADLPVGAGLPSADAPRHVPARTRASAAVYEELSDALARRKRVTFTYRAMSTDLTEERTVEPYGLFFTSAHWYLAGRDGAREAIRNFRLDRITSPNVNSAKEGTPDFEIPADFRLREHARSRQAWELGDGDALTSVVRYTGSSGATVAAQRLGSPVEGDASCRSFSVRRVDAFARWLLSFAGELVPLSPSEVVRRYAEEVEAVATIYARDVEGAPPSPSVRAESGGGAPREWQPAGAAAQLRRLLHVVPQIADGEEHPIDEVADRVGTSVRVLQHDLYSLVERYDVPGGFVESVTLYLEAGRVSAQANHFLRPMRLTVSELCALGLGLRVLRGQRTPDEHAVLDRARERLDEVIAQLPDDPIPDAAREVSELHAVSVEMLAVVRTALRERRTLRLSYRKSGSSQTSEREICPLVLLSSKGMLYVVAQCLTSDGVRVFRMDRVELVSLTDETFAVPDDFSLDDVVRDGKVFSGEEVGTMRVRYSARIARWIAEREGLVVEGDGSLVIDHPLADRDWGVRHVLQYGRDAEVVAPDDVRAYVRDAVERMRHHGTSQHA